MNVSSADLPQLPAHIITHILGYLKLADFKNATMVCKLWYYASTDPQIAKTLVLRPTDENFCEIFQSNRKYYGVLKLRKLRFNLGHDHYFKLFKKVCPYIHELHIIGPDLIYYEFLKLLELSTNLESIHFAGFRHLTHLPPYLLPKKHERKLKKQIITNLSGVKNIEVKYKKDFYPLIVDVIRYAVNLTSLSFTGNYETKLDTFKKFLTLFDNDNVGNLRHLDMKFACSDYIDDFIENFVQIPNLNLKSLKLTISVYNWRDDIYKSSVFRKFILKLQSLEEFTFVAFIRDHLSLVCQHLVNLRTLNCAVLYTDQVYSELENLKNLQVLRYQTCSRESLVELDNFFKCKFENLKVFVFSGFVTEASLAQFCENHPNLIELNLMRLLTHNLEVVFKCLTKLRALHIRIGFKYLGQSHITEVENVPVFNPHHQQQYKITRLQDLEVFHLSELVCGLREEDVRQLKKLRRTNVHELFDKQTKTCKRFKIAHP